MAAKKEIHIDELCIEWGKICKETDLNFQQYVKQKELEGYKILYSEDYSYSKEKKSCKN